MNILAFDTTMAACSAAVLGGMGEVLASALEPMEKGQAEAIAPMIERVMAAAGISFEEIHRFAVTVGPGTFTGLRIGVAMARGLRLATGRPAIALNTLEAIFVNAGPRDRPVAVAIDARRGEVYLAVFGIRGETLVGSTAVPLEQAHRLLPAGPVGLIGTGAELIMSHAPRSDLERILGDLPVAAHFGRLALTGQAGNDPPRPLYLRESGAQRKQRPNPVIGPAGGPEAPVLAAIHGECFERSWPAAEFARLLALPGALALVAWSGGEPAAFLLIRRAAEESEILTIGTRPQYRKQGLARRLIEEAIKTLSSASVDRLFIEVAVSNAPARALYQRAGFARAGTRPAYYTRPGGECEDALIMRRDLAA